MAVIQKVVVVGATGSFGCSPAELQHFLFPPQVHAIQTDYSLASLEKAFEGKDAVICTLGHAGLGMQIDLVNAAEKAGVKRFIPSEFGPPRGGRDIPEYRNLQKNKLDVIGHLMNKAERNPQFTWSAFSTGTFLDRALITFPDFGFDIKNQSAIIFDSGNEPFTAMALSHIGQPVAASLEKFEETKNRYVGISSLRTTQNEILAVLVQQTGKQWTITNRKTKDILAEAKEKMASGDFKGGYIGFMIAQMFEDDAGRAMVDGSDNQLLQIQQEPLENLIEQVLGQI
ncbi:NmrA-like domain [Fusarium oxysporum f. sp. vasinfectum]|nr:NmrA-like domain [Fusarium oxysporum f. sp. vasinfectum]